MGSSIMLWNLLLIGTLLILLPTASSQYFDPNMDDQVYLNLTHKKVQDEVISTRQELVDQVEVVRAATRAFIGAKIKENLFKALRTLAEKELETMSMQNRPRQPRQDDDDDEEITTTERGLIPQLATILQAVFGSNVNVTKYVESASKLLPRPIGSQIVGVVSLLDPNQFTTTTAPKLITPPPVNGTNAAGVGQQASLVPTQVSSASHNATSTTILPRSSTSTDDEYDDIEDDDESRRKRQFNFKGINPLLIVNGMEAWWKTIEERPTSNVTSTQPTTYLKGVSTVEPEDGFDDDYTTKPSRVVSAVQGIRTQAQALRKGVPDLFQGAREAYKFLSTINGFLDNWEARLQAGSREEDDDK